METISNWLVIQFSAVVLVVAGCVVLATRLAGRGDLEPVVASRRWTVGAMIVVALWLGIPLMLAKQNVLNNFTRMPSPFMLILLASTVVTIILSAASPWGKRIANGFSFQALFGFQVFRILVETLLVIFHRAGVAPIQLTFEGRNFDIVTGVLALTVLIFFTSDRISKSMYAVLNLIGLGLLLNVVLVGFFSLPTLFRIFAGDNTWITQAPFIWLPTFLVQVALSGHILSFRKLLMERETNPVVAPAEAS